MIVSTNFREHGGLGQRSRAGITLAAVFVGGRGVALTRITDAATARRPEHDPLAFFEHHVLAVVDTHPVDPHLAPRAGLAAVDPLSWKAAALGHENDADGRLGGHLELDLLAETAAIATGAAAVRTQRLAYNE